MVACAYILCISAVVEVLNCVIVVIFFLIFCANIFISKCSIMCYMNFTEKLWCTKQLMSYHPIGRCPLITVTKHQDLFEVKHAVFSSLTF
jgi:hypothetical protein